MQLRKGLQRASKILTMICFLKWEVDGQMFILLWFLKLYVYATYHPICVCLILMCLLFLNKKLNHTRIKLKTQQPREDSCLAVSHIEQALKKTEYSNGKPKVSVSYLKPWRLVVSVFQHGPSSSRLWMTSSPLPLSISWISLSSGHFLVITGLCSRDTILSLESDSGSHEPFIHELNIISGIFHWA